MSSSPQSKKIKVDIEELAQTVWEHYRNYLDSFESGDEQGDIDELQELIEISSGHVKPMMLIGEQSDASFRKVTDLLPVLLSVSYFHLADLAISQYLMMKSQSNFGGKVDDEKEADAEVRRLLTKSLEMYPENAATWSMGANYGRMSHKLSVEMTLGWYEMAVKYSKKIRSKGLSILEDDSIEDPMVKEWVELLLLNQVAAVEFEDDEDEDEEDEEQAEDIGTIDQNEGPKNKTRENTDEKDEEDEEDKMESDGQYSSSAVEATSRFMCAMLWSMQGRHDLALSHLEEFPVSHRLHPIVWQVSKPSSNEPPTKAPLVFRPDEGILPKKLFESIKKVFAPDAIYWKESDYASRGYYSYFMDFKDGRQPRNLIEDVIVNHLLPRAQQVLDEKDASQICGFEWWTHTRPIQANLGHNLHFDTDESMLEQEGKVTHPILSSVLYLTGGGDDDPAGTTIILDQTPDSKETAEFCWQGVPKDNSFLLFPGNLLHGVLPCPGHRASASAIDERPSTERLLNGWNDSSKTETPPKTNRLTFMVGFWTRDVPATMKKRNLYGPCGPLPPNTEEHTWISEIGNGYEQHSSDDYRYPQGPKLIDASPLPQVSPAWERVKPNQKSEEGNDLHLDIPHAIDHRFFVHGAPECFRQSLFEDKSDGCE